MTTHISIWNHDRIKAVLRALTKSVDYSWSLALIQGLCIIVACYCFQQPPSSGVVVVGGGLVAVVMAVRADEGWSRTERIAWLFLAIVLGLSAIRALNKEAAEQNQHFASIVEGLDKTIQTTTQQFEAAMAKNNAILATAQQAASLAQENLENITGGQSFAVVTPQVWSGLTPIPLTIFNYGKHTLTGVTVTIRGRQAWNFLHDPNDSYSMYKAEASGGCP